MSAVDQLAFEPGQQIRCKTRFNEIYTGEVVAFDLNCNILIIKSPSSIGNNSNKDLHFLILSHVADMEVIEEAKADAIKDLPSIEMKHIQSRQQSAQIERHRLIEAVENGVSRDGIALFSSLSKKYDRPQDLIWRDKVQMEVMSSVVIKPPYKESDCELIDPKNAPAPAQALIYVKNIVKKFWENP